MTTYDFLSAKQAILSNVRTDINLTQFTFGQLLTELAHIMTTYDFLWAKQTILSKVTRDTFLYCTMNFVNNITHSTI